MAVHFCIDIGLVKCAPKYKYNCLVKLELKMYCVRDADPRHGLFCEQFSKIFNTNVLQFIALHPNRQ